MVQIPNSTESTTFLTADMCRMQVYIASLGSEISLDEDPQMTRGY